MDTNRNLISSGGNDQDPASSSSPEAVVMADPEEEMIVIGSDNPKVIEWEELQQELARLWSLSAALSEAKEKKDALSQKIQAIIKVRDEFLRQSNELEDIREKCEARKLHLEDMSMYTKKTLEDARNQREQLCMDSKMLLIAGKTLSAAHQQLQEANKLLAGKRGIGNLRNLQTMLRRRQQHMITQVSSLYPVKALNETKEKSDSSHGDPAGSSVSIVSKPQQTPHLTIAGLQLTAVPLKKMSLFSSKTEIQRSAAVLGNIAHAVFLIASYLDVPLRYPLRLGGSRTYVLDQAPSIESTSSDLVVNTVTGMNAKSIEFPLFLEGQEGTRAAYAIFLLNKDLEQLLNYIGAESLGPKHVLANLKELFRIIQSHQYIND